MFINCNIYITKAYSQKYRYRMIQKILNKVIIVYTL